MSLVKQARNGDTAIGVDCTPEEMQEIVKAVWPKDPCFSLKSINFMPRLLMNKRKKLPTESN